MDDLIVLKVGRHFRVSEGTKVIVGRDKAENDFLERFVPGRWTFRVRDFQGPLTLCEGNPSKGELRAAAALTARYSDGKSEPELTVACRHPDGRDEDLITPPADDDLLDRWRL